MREKLNIQADTIQQLLVNERLQEQIASRTIIVDEAGLLSVRQMQALCQLAEREKCRLLLVGDAKQHHSVEAGDALRALQKYAQVETVRLKEIHRQQNEEYRKVVRSLAGGMARAAFGRLDQLGDVHEHKDESTLLNQAASTYLDKVRGGQLCLVISPVWSEGNAFTSVLSGRLKDQGLLRQEEQSYKAVQSLQWTRSQKMQLTNYQVGDVLTFHRDGEGFSKHEMATVAGKDDKGLILERSDGGKSCLNSLGKGLSYCSVHGMHLQPIDQATAVGEFTCESLTHFKDERRPVSPDRFPLSPSCMNRRKSISDVVVSDILDCEEDFKKMTFFTSGYVADHFIPKETGIAGSFAFGLVAH